MKYPIKYFIFNIISILFILSGERALATSSYDSYSNTITIINGSNTIESIYTDISNSSALNYYAQNNTYLLNARINTSTGASLTIENTTVLLNNSIDDQYYIEVYMNLTIRNTVIKANIGKRYYIWRKGGSDGYSSLIDNVTIDGGFLRYRAWGSMYARPGSPYVRILNTIIKNVNMTGAHMEMNPGGNSEATVLTLGSYAGYNGLIQNLVIDNVSGGETYSGTIYFQSDATNLTLRNITIRNSSHSEWGTIHWYGSPMNLTIEDVTIENVLKGSGHAFSNKEGLCNVSKTHYYKNITIRNFKGYGFQTYQHICVSNVTSGAKVENLVIDGEETTGENLFVQSYNQPVNLWVFNATLKNTSTGIMTRNNKYFFTNTQVQNILVRMYSIVFGAENGEANWYDLTDIQIIDINSNPIANTSITIVPNATAPVPNVVDKWFNNQTNISTGSDGHTPLPTNERGTVAILRKRDYNSGYQTSYYSYSISIFDPNHLYTSTPTLIFPNGTLHQLSPLATTTVSPNSSWYRPNPNTYQNTTVITIDRARTNITFKFPNGSIMVSNATQTRFDATTDYPQSWVIINNTVPGFANKNLSFTADGITYANSTADSKGFVSFNYTGTWSKHTFEWVMESDGNVYLLDLIQIALHFGEATSAPYPNYDPNEDGKVDISDVVLVAREIF